MVGLTMLGELTTRALELSPTPPGITGRARGARAAGGLIPTVVQGAPGRTGSCRSQWSARDPYSCVRPLTLACPGPPIEPA
jgi:hypothetical protein